MATVKLKKPGPAEPAGATNANAGDLLVAFFSVIWEYQYYITSMC